MCGQEEGGDDSSLWWLGSLRTNFVLAVRHVHTRLCRLQVC